MKRIGDDIFDKIASLDNIEAAVNDSLRNRSKRNALTKDSARFLESREGNVALIREALLSGNLPEIRYRTFIRTEHGKRRRIDWNPSFRDNVIQHAIVGVLGPLLVAKMIPDTYSGIPGRGPSYGLLRARLHMRKFRGGPLFILKFDIRHYYQSIDTARLKHALRRYIKSERLLALLDHIIDSHPDGLPIGNFISQLLANIYLSEFDHWARRELGLVVMRYCDDIVMMSGSKARLWAALGEIRRFLAGLGLSVKDDAQVFPVERHGLDFMGFVVTRTTVRIRKRIERSFRKAARRFAERPCVDAYRSLVSYYGWSTSVPGGGLLWKRVVGKPLASCLELAKEAA